MRICSGAGCLRAIPDERRYCDECNPIVAVQADDLRTHDNGYNAELDRLRKSPRWKNGTQPRILRRDPFCRRCDRRMSELVDHIVPAQIALVQAQQSGLYVVDKWAGYFIESNLQGLCRPCHGDKTLEDKIHTGPWPSVIDAQAVQPKRVWSF